MTQSQTQQIAALQARLGHDFDDPSLLKRALTHSSAGKRNSKNSDYERLEFLGDRVLGLAVAEMLLERFPDAPEGHLARHLNRLVRKETCAAIAEEIGLGEFLIMSASEADSGGRGKMTILGDACEAVLGALFRDGGYGVARGVIRALWEAWLDDESKPLSDAKSVLQEWAQGSGLPLPFYEEMERKGPDHEPYFIARVLVEGHDAAVGEGPTKRAAEQSAASTMLRREGIWKNVPG